MKNLFSIFVSMLMVASGVSAKVPMLDTYNIKRAIEENEKGNKDGALEFFNKEVAENPKNGYAYYGIASIEYEKGHYDLAIEALVDAERFIPKKDKEHLAMVYIVRGATLVATGDTVAALTDFTKGISLDPKDTDSYLRRAEIYFQMQDYDKADADYQKVLELNPASELGHMGLGRNALRRNDTDKAIEKFNKVAMMYPEYSSAFAFRGEAFFNRNEYIKAIDDFCRALEINKSPKAYTLLLQFPKEQTDLVVAKLKGLCVKNPSDGYYWYVVANVLDNRKRFKEAVDAYLKCYEIEPSDDLPWLIAYSYQNLGRYDEALRYIDMAIESDGEDTDLVMMKADIIGESGDYERAITEYDRYIELRPDYSGGYYRRGWFNDVAFNTDAAINDYKMALTLDPDYAYAHLGLANMYMRKGEKEKALKEYETVVGLDTVPNGTSCAMYALLELGRKEEAIEFMNNVIDVDPDDCGTFYDATCLYTHIGDTEKAMEYLEKCLDKGFRRFHHLHHDDDLDTLRELPEFEPLVRKYELKAMEEAGNDKTGNNSKGHDNSEKLTEVPFTKDDGCLIVKCSINGLPLSFIFDTGASIVSLSQMEANFMLKNGFLTEKDMKGTGRFRRIGQFGC